METFTGATADHWKIGRRGHDDGAVLFLFMRDRKVRIEVGYGLESALTDADAHRIIAGTILPRMRADDVNGAVSAGVAAMLATITPSFAGVSAPAQRRPIPLQVFMYWLIYALVALTIAVRLAADVRYGYLVIREGSAAARQDMRPSRFWGTNGFLAGLGFREASSGGGGDSNGGGFSAGGGSFGGGGSSGSW